MPTSVECRYRRKKISVEEAIQIRADLPSAKPPAGSSPFKCVECGCDVWPHKAGNRHGAYFAHFERNNCPLSHGHGTERPSKAEGDFPGELSRDQAEEGAVSLRLHRTRERNRRLVQAKLAQVKESKGRLVCDACGFDFESTYGEHGRDYIECHHTIPLASRIQAEETDIEDLVLLCSNCHSMVHRHNGCLSIPALKGMISQNKPGRKI